MKIQLSNPPNIDELDAVFHCKGKPILFAWADTIYNPCSITVHDFLLAHEAVHGMRQLGTGGAEQWWGKYIADEEFRYDEELAAHRVELAVLSRHITDRNARSRLIMSTASRLVAPLYAYSNKRLLDARRALASTD